MHTAGDEDLYLQQAVVFIEDAIQYRSINHRVDTNSLRLYRWYYSRLWQWGLDLTIAVLLMLAFIERPSSFSYTSDPRFRPPPWEPPYGLTEGIEIVCLVIFAIDFATKSYLIGWEEFQKRKWLMVYTLAVSASVIDWALMLCMYCDQNLRVRRLIRPFFLLQNSTLMKKTLKCIKRTLPEIASVILLLALHLCLFTMIGMLLFAKGEKPKQNGEWEAYFRDLPTSLSSLLVLLTTANNPDVMIPAYSLNRGYSIFFILFSGFGSYFLMNLLTAIVYNQFRGYLLMSVQASILRRRLGVRAAFEVMSCQGRGQDATHSEENVERVRVDASLQVMARVQMKSYYRQAIIKRVQQLSDGFIQWEAFRRLFDELDKDRIKQHPPKPEYNSSLLQRLQLVFSHYYVTVVGNAVALTNVMCICVLQITIFATYRLPFPKWNPALRGLMSLWEMVRLVNILILVRFLRIIPNIKLMALIASTLVDLVKNLRAFAGILVVVFYVFAVLGIWLFQGAITAPRQMSMKNITVECGSYEQLGYWPNNFDDFASSLVLLYNVMLVNNWQVFMDAYTRYTTEWSKVYFVSWWLTSSVMWVNLFVALILENFIHKWDRSVMYSVADVERTGYETTVQLMFREQIQEPTEEELVTQLHQHPHLHLS
ncbi:two pore channel protein 2-like isoform X2 [Salvelinus fontinalis]|uniref:two pore channel protein 2-like isoform X2 n=1 Tax=Salvelinus fontinalis TaxID=8038 RepID=UPI002484F300|nr:two pore channel protein 2-like isoform X2 [Salvelinus fontinalis]